MIKRIFIGMVCAFGMLTVQAQNFRYGVTAGLNLNTSAGDMITVGSHIGYYAGVKGVYDFSGESTGLYLTTTLALSQKSFKSQAVELMPGDPHTATYGKTSAHYLEIPVRVGYGFAVGKSTRVLLEAGPYASLALWGKDNVYTDGKKVGDRSAFDEYGIRRFDFGLSLGAGVQLAKHYQLMVSYNHGLAQLNHPDRSQPGTVLPTRSLYHRTFNFTVAYMF